MQEVFEKIIGKLKKYIKDNDAIHDTNKNCNGGGAFLKAIYVVERVAAEYNNGWIPVEERLPEESLNSVLGWDEYRKRCCFVEYRGGRWILGNDIDSVNITAWQPLPKPYQKGE